MKKILLSLMILIQGILPTHGTQFGYGTQIPLPPLERQNGGEAISVARVITDCNEIATLLKVNLAKKATFLRIPYTDWSLAKRAAQYLQDHYLCYIGSAPDGISRIAKEFIPSNNNTKDTIKLQEIHERLHHAGLTLIHYNNIGMSFPPASIINIVTSYIDPPVPTTSSTSSTYYGSSRSYQPGTNYNNYPDRNMPNYNNYYG